MNSQNMIELIEKHENTIEDTIRKILELLSKKTISKDIIWSPIKVTRGQNTEYEKTTESNNGFRLDHNYPGGNGSYYYIYFDGNLIYSQIFQYKENNIILQKLTQLWTYIYEVEVFPDKELKYKNIESKLDAALERLECTNKNE